jgi:hypothetical protein
MNKCANVQLYGTCTVYEENVLREGKQPFLFFILLMYFHVNKMVGFIYQEPDRSSLYECAFFRRVVVGILKFFGWRTSLHLYLRTL